MTTARSLACWPQGYSRLASCTDLDTGIFFLIFKMVWWAFFADNAHGDQRAGEIWVRTGGLWAEERQTALRPAFPFSSYPQAAGRMAASRVWPDLQVVFHAFELCLVIFSHKSVKVCSPPESSPTFARNPSFHSDAESSWPLEQKPRF